MILINLLISKKYFLTTYSSSDIILGIEDTAEYKVDKCHPLEELFLDVDRYNRRKTWR